MLDFGAGADVVVVVLVPETTADVVPETTADAVPETTADVVPETTADVVPETTADVVPETYADVVPVVQNVVGGSVIVKIWCAVHVLNAVLLAVVVVIQAWANS